MGKIKQRKAAEHPDLDNGNTNTPKQAHQLYSNALLGQPQNAFSRPYATITKAGEAKDRVQIGIRPCRLMEGRRADLQSGPQLEILREGAEHALLWEVQAPVEELQGGAGLRGSCVPLDQSLVVSPVR